MYYSMLKKKIDKHNKYTTIVFTVIVTLIVVSISWKLNVLQPKSDRLISQKNVSTKHELNFSNFTVIVPDNYVLVESPEYPPEVYGKVEVSLLSYVERDGNMIINDDGCTRVEGVETSILQRNEPFDTGYSKWYPTLSIETWNNNRLRYADRETEKEIQKRLQNLLNLSKLSPLDLYSQTNASFKSNMEVPIYNPMAGHLYCSGIYSLPSFIEKQNLPPDSNWNEVYFGEVFEGNGDTFGVPVKVVLARRGETWLIVKEQQTYPGNYKSNCPFGNLSSNEFDCANAEWSKLRNPASYRAWVQQVLSWVQ